MKIGVDKNIKSADTEVDWNRSRTPVLGLSTALQIVMYTCLSVHSILLILKGMI